MNTGSRDERQVIAAITAIAHNTGRIAVALEKLADSDRGNTAFPEEVPPERCKAAAVRQADGHRRQCIRFWGHEGEHDFAEQTPIRPVS